MPESLGARLRQRREARQVALAAIAEQTKIKRSLLEALERDDVSRWPTGIFRRAYVRAYAHAIGLEPDVVVREFLEVHPDPAETVEMLSAVASEARKVSGPPTRLRHIVGSAFESLSRLRTSPPVEGLVVAGEAPIDQPSPAEPELPDALDPPQGRGCDGGSSDTVVADAPATATPLPDSALLAVARVCTELGRVEHVDELPPLVEEAAKLLDATGLVVWLWDARAEGLRPALAHGYSADVLAQLPPVSRDADNATAAAFRSAETCVINGSDGASGALVVPLQTPTGCAGVLALELRRGGERTESVRAVATILAALLAQLTGGAQPTEARQSDPKTRRA